MKASGRINIIGEHVDYCGGKVLPASISLKCNVLGRENGSDKIRIALYGFDELFVLDINNLDKYKDLKFVNYQAGIAYYLQESGVKLVGCGLYYQCEVPFGSGLSSSAAIEVATAVILNEFANTRYDLTKIAILAQKAENSYVGMNCGIMDQFVSAKGKKDCAILLDCATLEHEYISLNLGDYSIIIANCNKPHNSIESKYNERRRETETALEIINEHKKITTLSQLSVEEFCEVAHFLPSKIRDRVKHVITECERVNKAVLAIKNGEIKQLGELINQSHFSLRDLYEVTGFELDVLTQIEREQACCLGARMIGGGFGGCTISIVKQGYEQQFIQAVSSAYRQETGYKADFYHCHVDDGISVENI